MRRLLTIVILVLLAGAGGYAYLKHGKTEDTPTVTQAAVQQGPIVQAVQATGTFEALRTVQVGSQVSGTVSELDADFNSIVKKDQVIARLDPTLLQVQVDVQQATIDRQQTDIASMKVQLENDQLTLRRAQNQFKAGLMSRQDFEAADLQVKNRLATIDSSEKQLVQATANLHQAQLNVSYCTITSPIDGVVVSRLVDLGQTVQASMATPQFFTIATDLTMLKLSAGVDEADIGYIRPSMPVTFSVDAYGARQFVGTVDAVRLNATSVNNVVTYPVWINVRNPNLELRPSMTANLKIIVDKAGDVLKVPNQALRFRPTADIYTWLGMTPPTAGRGRGASARPGAPGLSQREPVDGARVQVTPMAERDAAKIDELFEPVPKRTQSGQVWLYDEKAADPNKRLRQASLWLGLTDGQFSELMSPGGENLTVGTLLVTGVVPPPSALPKPGQNIFQQNPRGGFGPGGPGGFGPGGPGGGRGD